MSEVSRSQERYGLSLVNEVPNEIKLLIFDHLSRTKGGIGACSKLARTCRAQNRIWESVKQKYKYESDFFQRFMLNSQANKYGDHEEVELEESIEKFKMLISRGFRQEDFIEVLVKDSRSVFFSRLKEYEKKDYIFDRNFLTWLTPFLYNMLNINILNIKQKNNFFENNFNEDRYYSFSKSFELFFLYEERFFLLNQEERSRLASGCSDDLHMNIIIFDEDEAKKLPPCVKYGELCIESLIKNSKFFDHATNEDIRNILSCISGFAAFFHKGFVQDFVGADDPQAALQYENEVVSEDENEVVKQIDILGHFCKDSINNENDDIDMLDFLVPDAMEGPSIQDCCAPDAMQDCSVSMEGKFINVCPNKFFSKEKELDAVDFIEAWKNGEGCMFSPEEFMKYARQVIEDKTITKEDFYCFLYETISEFMRGPKIMHPYRLEESECDPQIFRELLGKWMDIMKNQQA